LRGLVVGVRCACIRGSRPADTTPSDRRHQGVAVKLFTRHQDAGLEHPIARELSRRCDAELRLSDNAIEAAGPVDPVTPVHRRLSTSPTTPLRGAVSPALSSMNRNRTPTEARRAADLLTELSTTRDGPLDVIVAVRSPATAPARARALDGRWAFPAYDRSASSTDTHCLRSALGRVAPIQACWLTTADANDPSVTFA
jgi:hypothetical protein